jgi:hypothetical protein
VDAWQWQNSPIGAAGFPPHGDVARLSGDPDTLHAHHASVKRRNPWQKNGNGYAGTTRQRPMDPRVAA